MEHSLTVLLYEYWPALLFLGFGGFLVSRGAKKRREGLVSRNTAAARQQGMDYAPPAGDDTAGGAMQGTHRFSGTTRGVAWTAEVTLLTSEVDDGLATGASMIAALHAVRARNPAHLVCAVPVASPDSLERVRKLADETVCLAAPAGFAAVGQYYLDFRQVEDAEVATILQASP